MNIEETSNTDNLCSTFATTEFRCLVRSGGETKIKIFGFELKPYICDNMEKNKDEHCFKGTCIKGDHESVNSSNSNTTVLTSKKPMVTEGPKPAKILTISDHDPEEKKLKCQYCLKEFANSQALGGHQKAHKKERMKKKIIQLQTQRASLIKSYLGYDNSQGDWFYDPGFTPYDESQISFRKGLCDYQDWDTSVGNSLLMLTRANKRQKHDRFVTTNSTSKRTCMS